MAGVKEALRARGTSMQQVEEEELQRQRRVEKGLAYRLTGVFLTVEKGGLHCNVGVMLVCVGCAGE